MTDAEGRLTTISTIDARGNVAASASELYDGKTAITTFTYDDLRQYQDPDGPARQHLGGRSTTSTDLRFFTDPTETNDRDPL